MAGSLNHCTSAQGKFTFNLIENMGDAFEACEDMFNIIAFLTEGDERKLRRACHYARTPMPDVLPIFGATKAKGTYEQMQDRMKGLSK